MLRVFVYVIELHFGFEFDSHFGGESEVLFGSLVIADVSLSELGGESDGSGGSFGSGGNGG